MSCENGYLPTSTLANLILRSNGDSLLNANSLLAQAGANRDDLTFDDSSLLRGSTLNADNLAGVRSLATLLDSGAFDTGSSLSDILSGESDLYDQNGNLLAGAGANSGQSDADDNLNTASTADFLDTSAVFSEIENFSAVLDLTSPTETLGADTIVQVTNALNEFLSTGLTNTGGSTVVSTGDSSEGAGDGTGGIGNGDGGATGGASDGAQGDTGAVDGNIGATIGLGDPDADFGDGTGGDGGGSSGRFDNIGDFPNLGSRLSSVPALSFTEVGSWLIDSDTNTDDLLIALSNNALSSTTSSTLSTAMGTLEDFYTTNIGKDIARGLCSVSASLLQKILGIFVIIDTAKAAIALIKNLFELDLFKLIEQLLARLTLEALIAAIKKIIKKVYDKIRAKILRIIEKFKDLVCDIKGSKAKAMQILGRSCTEMEDFYSDDNLKTFQEKIEEFIAKLASEFERLTFENVAMLLARLCNFIDYIVELLFGPLNEFKELGRTMQAEDRMISSVSLLNTKYAVEHGALRLSAEDRRVLAEDARVSMNDKSATIQELIDGASTDYVTSKEMSCDEMSALFCLRGEGVPGSFTFSGDILEGKPKNYKLVKPIVFARLMRMAARLDREFVVIKGYEQKKKEAGRGSNNNTIMSTGAAIHIEANSLQEVAEIIVSASQEGFVGIGVHSGYVHLDIGPRKLTWVDGYSSGFQASSSDNFLSSGSSTNFLESFSAQNLLYRHEKKEFTRKVE